MQGTAEIRLFVQRIDLFTGSKQILKYFIGCLFCILVGAAIAFFPWWLVLIMLSLPLILVGAIFWAFPILILTLALIFQAIPGEFVPLAGSFRIYELLILYLAFAVFIRGLWSSQSIFSPLGPLIWPILYLYACVLVSAIYVKYFAPNPNLITSLRGFVPWLLIPIICNVVRTTRQKQMFLTGIISIALMVSIFVMVESVLSVKLLDNRTEILDTANTDITRSLAGGTTYLMVFAILWSVNKIISGNRWWVALILVAIVAAGGVAVGFGRGVWLASCLAFLIASWISRGLRGMLLAAFAGSVLVALLLTAFSAVKPRMVDAVIERALGVSDEVKSGGSFRWRQLENEHALAVLVKQPFTGVGIGGEYKKTVSQQGSFANETQYIHNAYMGLMVKMGFQAILFPLLMIAVFLSMAWKVRKKVDKERRPLYGAIIGAFFVPVITSFTQPEWIESTGVAAFCVTIAGLSLLVRFTEQNLRAAQVPAPR